MRDGKPRFYLDEKDVMFDHEWVTDGAKSGVNRKARDTDIAAFPRLFAKFCEEHPDCEHPKVAEVMAAKKEQPKGKKGVLGAKK